MKRLGFLSALLLLGAGSAAAVTGRWEVIGPGPASPNLPGVSSLAFSDRGLLAAGQNGLYRRVDDNDWNLVLESIGENVNSSLPNSLTWIGIAPGSPQVLLTGAGNPAYGTGGIYRSADAGASWQMVLGGWGLLAAASAPSDPSVVYGSVRSGFPLQAATSRSSDGGLTWTPLAGLGPSIVFALAVDPKSSDVVYAAVGASSGGLAAGLYRSSDGGASWTLLGVGLPNDTFTTLAADPTTSGIVYVGTNASGVFRSEDGGNTWIAVKQGLENERVSTLAVDPQTPATVYVGTLSGAFRSTDSGGHWLPIGLRGQWVYSFTFDPTSSSTLYVGSTAGVQRITLSPTVPCVADAQTLCLNGGRFRVQATFRSPTVVSGVGQSVPISDISGSFWFFDAANLEIIVKVLEGTSVNDHFWVLYGALSNVEFTITVTDTVTGAIQSYFSQQDPYTPASAADTIALPSSTPSGEVPASGSSSQASAARAATAGLCTPDASTLCLLGGRFQARVEFRSAANAPEAAAPAVPVTDDTGYFWFFDAPNVELMLKVLDGTAINGHFWIFYASLSNVAYTVTVTDLQTGAVRVYENPPGQLLSVDDTKAF